MMAPVVGLIVLGIVTLPALANARAKSIRVRCQDGLGRVGVAIRVHADGHGDRYPNWVVVVRADGLSA
ncbi:MAG: hypothetical protein KF833_10520 [Verrucomicrobiae bacterium]|nr:hypothetical protein [Verrucomicrobiae bacterium]